jgi:hypothetical protein
MAMSVRVHDQSVPVRLSGPILWCNVLAAQGRIQLGRLQSSSPGVINQAIEA